MISITFIRCALMYRTRREMHAPKGKFMRRKKFMGKSLSKNVSKVGSNMMRLPSFKDGNSQRSTGNVLNIVLHYLETDQQEMLILSPGDLEFDEMWAEKTTSLQTRRVCRSGPFYAKSSGEMGDWTFEDGILKLQWSRMGRFLEFTQIDPNNELAWRCDTLACVIDVMNLDQSAYLPAWVNPLKPEDAKKVFRRRLQERELKLRMEEGKARGDIAQQFRECPLCFFKLHLFPVAVLRFQSKRACTHYLHSFCANMYKGNQETKNERIGCPICLKRFTEVKTLPDLLQDPRLWFQLCDTDLTGSLDRDELMEGLVAVLPVERERLEKAVAEYWSFWDTSGDGYIGFQEFIDAKSGLKSFLINNFNIFKLNNEADKLGDAIPPLDSKPREWFDYWDQNKNGTIDRVELSRALIKTFCVTSWGDPLIKRAQDMASLSLNLWDALGYKPRGKIDFQEFMKPFGLADQLIHNQIHGSFFGEDELNNT